MAKWQNSCLKADLEELCHIRNTQGTVNSNKSKQSNIKGTLKKSWGKTSNKSSFIYTGVSNLVRKSKQQSPYKRSWYKKRFFFSFCDHYLRPSEISRMKYYFVKESKNLFFLSCQKKRLLRINEMRTNYEDWMLLSFETSKVLEKVLAKILWLVYSGGSRHSMESPRNISWTLIDEVMKMMMMMIMLSESSKQGNQMWRTGIKDVIVWHQPNARHPRKLLTHPPLPQLDRGKIF